MKAVVLAGGKGTRLAPYTQILPKPLMPIGDKPILALLLRQMQRVGIEEVILTVGHMADLLESYFGNGSKFGIRLTYSREIVPLGTAGPLSLLSGLDETFMVTNGDVLTTLNFIDLIDWHKEHSAAATIAMHERKVHIDFGVIETNGDHTIKGYIEKPSIDYSVSMGVYIFEPRVLPFIAYNQYLDFPDLVLKLIAAGETVVGFPFSGYWQDLGRPDDYTQATQEFYRMHSQFYPEEG
ncbi:MAG: sugar phosphate nucleotidyltransferase [Chloroflexota bacterium]